MTIDQRAIQVRSLDFHQTVSSDEYNQRIKALVKRAICILSGFDFIKLSASVFKIRAGLCVKDRVMIEYNDAVSFDVSNYPDGEYFAVLEYTYEKVSPPSIAEVKIIDEVAYSANPDQYLFLCFLSVSSGKLQTILGYYPTDPTIRRYYGFGHNEYGTLDGGNDDTNEFYHLTEVERNAVGCLSVCCSYDHNLLSELEGGDSTNRWHMTENEHDAISAITSGDTLAWYDNPLYCCGARIDACFLDVYDDSSFSPWVHNHDHNETFTSIYPHAYHLTCTQKEDLVSILSGCVAFPNASRVEGVLGSSFSEEDHCHFHYNISCVQGGAAFQNYHLSSTERDNISLVYAGCDAIPNTSAVSGVPAANFCLLDHAAEHNHQLLLCLQGGAGSERYHVDSLASDFIDLVKSGCSVGVSTCVLLDNSAYPPQLCHWYDFSQVAHSHNHDTLSCVKGSPGQLSFHMASGKSDALKCGKGATTANFMITKSALQTLTTGMSHNTRLTCFNGGTTNERYHLSGSEFCCMTNLGDASSVHKHSSCYNSKTLSNSSLINITGDTFCCNLGLGNNQVKNLCNPRSTIGHDISTKWYADSVLAGSLNHNLLYPVSLQGGMAGEYYHICDAVASDLTSGGEANLQHCHNDYYLKTEADTTFTLLSGGTMLGDMSTPGIVDLLEPSNAADPSTYTYAKDNIDIPSSLVVRHSQNAATAMISKGFFQVDSSISFNYPHPTSDTYVFPYSPQGTTNYVTHKIFASKQSYMSTSTATYLVLVYSFGSTYYSKFMTMSGWTAPTAITVLSSASTWAASELIKRGSDFYCIFYDSGSLVLRKSLDVITWSTVATIGAGSWGRLSLNPSDNTLGFVTGTTIGIVSPTDVINSLTASIAVMKLVPAIGQGYEPGFYAMASGNHTHFVKQKTGSSISKYTTGVATPGGSYLPTVLSATGRNFHTLLANASSGNIPMYVRPFTGSHPSYQYTATSSSYQMESFTTYDVTEIAQGGIVIGARTRFILGSSTPYYIHGQVMLLTRTGSVTTPKIAFNIIPDTAVEGDRLLLPQTNFYYQKL